MVGSLLLFSILHLSLSVNLQTNQSHCIFGSRDSGCLYPCHCRAESEEGCDPYTGKCDSGMYLAYYLCLNYVSICQKRVFNNCCKIYLCFYLQ